jgi:antitoxin component of MazEF toxin-antitoxin module
MLSKLVPVGEDLALLIDPGLLEELGIGRDTPLEITTDGKAIIIRPVEDDHQARVPEAANRIMDIHHETFRRLAES